jgi:hypothetical protein
MSGRKTKLKFLSLIYYDAKTMTLRLKELKEEKEAKPT